VQVLFSHVVAALPVFSFHHSPPRFAGRSSRKNSNPRFTDRWRPFAAQVFSWTLSLA